MLRAACLSPTNSRLVHNALKHVANKRHGQAPLRTQRSDIQPIKQIIKAAHVAATAFQQVQRRDVRQFKAAVP